MSRFHYTNVSSKYGAPMGRASFKGDCDGKRFRLQRVPLDSGGYDPGGAYWGIGQPLYRTEAEPDWVSYFRAPSREAAKAVILAEYPNARFYR